MTSCKKQDISAFTSHNNHYFNFMYSLLCFSNKIHPIKLKTWLIISKFLPTISFKSIFKARLSFNYNLKFCEALNYMKGLIQNWNVVKKMSLCLGFLVDHIGLVYLEIIIKLLLVLNKSISSIKMTTSSTWKGWI